MNDRILKFADSRQFIGRIARSGENNTRSLAFDCSAVLAEYPAAQIIAVIQRPQGDPYTVTPDADGTIRRITLTAYDLEFNGHLQIELRVIDGEKILKSAIYSARVDDSIRGEADAPGQPVRDVLDRLEAEIKQAQAVVDDIRQKLENGEFNGSDAEVTAANIEAALGYVPVKEVRARDASVTGDGVVSVNSVEIAAYVEPRNTLGSLDFSTLSLAPFGCGDPFAFLETDRIIIESTTDGGQTWVDAGIEDSVKKSLFTPGNINYGVQIPLIDGITTPSCGLRITISFVKFNVPDGTPETEKINHWILANMNGAENYRYAYLCGMYFWVSGRDVGIQMLCKVAMDGASEFDTTVCSSPLHGWAGPNFIQASQLLGGYPSIAASANLKYVLRFEFFPIASTNGPLDIYNISAVSSSDWGSIDSYIQRRILYTFDADRNVTFPANVTVTGKLISPQSKALENTTDDIVLMMADLIGGGE